jgi:DNA polymerase-3 subunit alpha
VLESLVQAGAADALGGKRSAMTAAIDAALEWGQRRKTDRESGQGSLFGARGATSEPADPKRPDLPDWDDTTRLAHEKATLGFYVSGHPLGSLGALLDDFATHRTGGLRDLVSGTEVRVGGIVTDFRRRKSKKGAWWGSFQLEDLEGVVEVLVFPKAFEQHQPLLANDRAVLVSGRVESEDGRVRLTAGEIGSLDDLRERKADGVEVRLEADEVDDDLVGRLQAAFQSHRGDTAVYLEIVRRGAFRALVRTEPQWGVAPSPALAEDLEAIVGPGRIRYRARGPRRPEPSAS